MSVGRAKQRGGIAAAVAGLIAGFIVILICKLPPWIAAAVATADVLIGICLYRAGSKQIERERTGDVVAFSELKFRRSLERGQGEQKNG